MSNIVLNAGSGGSTLGTDQVTGVDYQIVKIGFSATGVAPVQVSASNPLPNNLFLQSTAASVNSGTKDGGTLRVVLATDQPSLSNAQPVSQSGSWTVTVNGVVADATAFTRGTTTQLPVGGVVEALQAGLTVAQTRALSLTTGALLRVDGSNVTQPVSGTVTANAGSGTMAVSAASLPLPSGASTAAKQPALGTAGSASTDVITVQGIASMTKLLVTPDSVALPANQSVNVSQINGVTPLMGNGTTGTGSLRVTVSSDNTAFSVNAIQSGTWTVQPGNTPNTTPWLVTDTPATSGGLSRNYQIAPATPAKTVVKGSAGQLYAIKASNNNASPRYVKLWDNVTGSVTLGTTACDDQFEIPGNANGAGFVYNVDKGIAFANGIIAAVTGAIASADNTGISANEVILTLYYK